MLASCNNNNHCGNGVQDGDETGVDCGGSCVTLCPVSNNPTCSDESLLVNKWWYCTFPPTSSTSYNSFYYQSNGILKLKSQSDPTGNGGVVGTWSLNCNVISHVDTSSLIPNYDFTITSLDDSSLVLQTPFGGRPHRDYP